MARFLVVLDVDSTLIENEAIELLADEAGCGDAVAAITERAMAGELDFRESLAERVLSLRGLPVDALERAAARIIVTAGAQQLVDAVHDADGVIGVVSGGFHELLDPLAERLGLDMWRANGLDVANGSFTGATTGTVIDAPAKADALREWAAERDVPLRRTIAVGDGANDIEMMRIAGLAVAFNARPIVRAAAHISIVQRDLSLVLPLLGLRG